MFEEEPSLFKKFAVWLAGVGGFLELWCIVYPVEGLQRLWFYLDPRVHIAGPRIRKISEGRQPKKSESFIVFSLYAPRKTPVFTETLFRAIESSQVNLVISTGARLTAEQRQSLLGKCHLLIERANLGRDFGAYADGIRVLQQRYSDKIERLILLNDSLYYLENGLSELIAELNGQHDVIGVTEVFEHHYHIGSYAISFGKRVLVNSRFRNYWRKYLPISTRRWSIHHGELDLTRTVLRAGFRPKVLYHGARLTPYMQAADMRELLMAIRLLPSYFRQQHFARFDRIRTEQTEATLSALESLSKSARRFQKLSSAGADLRGANIARMISMSYQTASVHGELDRAVLADFTRRIVATINAHNQMHVGGFLFMKYLGMPVFKRDLFFREVYRLEDIDEALMAMKTSLRDEIMADLRQKGTQQHLRGLQKILGRHGSI
jgi:hypothetical protein